MNNENMMNLFNESATNTFDFSKSWSDDSISDIDGDDDDIIIGSSNSSDDSDFVFDSSFDDEDKVLNIDEDTLSFDVKDDDKSISFDESSSELDKVFDSIYNGVEDANDLISQINLKKQTLAETEKEIANLKEQISREREEFSKYMDSQRNALLMERKQLKERTVILINIT